MTNPTLWNQILVWPILNLLIGFYRLCELVHLPSPLGWAIILLTIFIRVLLYPLMQAQLKSAKKMANLKPHLDALNAKHKDNKQALQQAQLELYKQHGINPASGCLPLLIQMPVLIALYNVFYQVLQNGNLTKLISDINSIVYLPFLKISSLNLDFFGTNLAVKPSEWQKYGWWLLSVPLITALLQWWQTKLMAPQASTNLINQANESKLKAEDKKPQDTAAEMQKQMALITPVMFGIFAFQFPLGLSLYWNIFGLFGIFQQIAINKSYGRN